MSRYRDPKVGLCRRTRDVFLGRAERGPGTGVLELARLLISEISIVFAHRFRVRLRRPERRRGSRSAHQRRPPRLMRGAEALAGVAVEELVEQ